MLSDSLQNMVGSLLAIKNYSMKMTQTSKDDQKWEARRHLRAFLLATVLLFCGLNLAITTSARSNWSIINILSLCQLKTMEVWAQP